jgi:hypothetical protein
MNDKIKINSFEYDRFRLGEKVFDSPLGIQPVNGYVIIESDEVISSTVLSLYKPETKKIEAPVIAIQSIAATDVSLTEFKVGDVIVLNKADSLKQLYVSGNPFNAKAIQRALNLEKKGARFDNFEYEGIGYNLKNVLVRMYWLCAHFDIMAVNYYPLNESETTVLHEAEAATLALLEKYRNESGGTY